MSAPETTQAKMSRCSCFPDGEQQHPLFLFMAVTNEEGLRQGVNVPSYLGVSSNPVKRIEELNGKDEVPAANRVARKGAPYWMLKMVIGPFAKGARQLAKDWASRSRKVACRILFAVQMVCRINECFESHPDKLLQTVGCIPTEKVVIWAHDRHEIEMLVGQHKIKRPRA